MGTGARQLAACAAALASLGALACTRTPEPGGPVPLSVVPAQGTDVSAVGVEIAGRDFDAWTRVDFSDGRDGGVDARFAAALLPAGGGDAVALEGVTLTPRRTLQATVPAGLARGVYRLHVTDPRGRTGVLEEAFRVVASQEAVTGFRVDVLEAPVAGVPFAVSLAAVDAQGLIVEGFDGSVSLSRGAGALTPASAGPFARGRLRIRATVTDLVAAERITADDGQGRSGASDPFDVVAGPPVAIVFPLPSVTAAAGACSPPVEVELRDVLAHPARAGTEVVAALQAAPPEVELFADAACTAPATSVRIPAGAARATIRFRSAAAGTVTLRVVPATLPSACQEETVSP